MIENQNNVIKYNINFSKKSDMIYISHLDLMMLFRRAIRRAKLPFVLSNGFTKRVKISMPKALKLGIESDNESMVLCLKKYLQEKHIMDSINSQLPEGIKIFKVIRK